MSAAPSRLKQARTPSGGSEGHAVPSVGAPLTESRFDYDGPAALLPTLTAALERVVDPEVAMNIVDVGLVYGVAMRDGRVDVKVTMTSAACPVQDVIVEDIEFQLDQTLPEHLKIHVELVWEPPWTSQRLSPRARQFMGW